MRQSFSYILLITWVMIAFSCKTHFIQKNYDTQNFSVSEEISTLDSSVVKLYLPYKNILEKDMDRVISYSNVEMTKDKPESYLTNFLSDLMVAQGARIAREQNQGLVPSISFFNYGGIRSTLPKGAITVGNIFELMPFENEMVFLQLEGTQVQTFLNYVAAKGGGAVGGVSFKISDRKALDVTVGGERLDEGKTYWIVTNDYVAGGGDGLEVFKHSKQYKKSGLKIRNIIIEYLEKKHERKETLTVKLDGRISNG